MAKKKPVRTIHYMEVAESLKAQNEAVMMLLSVVRSVLAVCDNLPSSIRTQLETQAEATQKAMWPEDDQ